MQGSAEIGAAAQWWLAQLYLRGQGLLQDCEVATKWLQRAADQGEAFAQWDLGKLYRDGKGVHQDDIVAHMWLNLTAAQGYRVAAQERDALAKRMTRDQILKAQKLAREWKPKTE